VPRGARITLANTRQYDVLNFIWAP